MPGDDRGKRIHGSRRSGTIRAMSVEEALRASARVGIVAALLALAAGTLLTPAFFDPLVPAVLAVLFATLLASVVPGVLAGVLPRGSARSAAVVAGAVLGAIAAVVVVAFAVDRGGVLALAAAIGALAGAVAGRACVAPRGWRTGLAVGTAALLAATGVRAVSTTAAAAGGKLVVVGVDGGTWRVMGPLVERGELPTVARIEREGVHGVLTSMEPTASPVVWTTIATGRLPAAHGIHDFYATQNDDLRSARFWEIAAAHGDSVGIFEWLVTWPPDDLPGFIVPGWLARDAQTRPADLGWLKRLGELAHGGSRALYDGLRFASTVSMAEDGADAWRLRDRRATYRAGRYVQQAIVGDVFLERYRRERPGVAAVVFYGTDALSHAYWNYQEPDPDVPAEDVALYGDTIREYYRRLDGFLGRLLTTVGPETSVLVISDHGFHGAQQRDIAVSSAKVVKALHVDDRFTAYSMNRRVFLTHRHPRTAAARKDVDDLATMVRALTIDGEPVLQVGVEPATSVSLQLAPGMDRRDPGTRIEGSSTELRLADVITPTSWTGSHEPAGILLGWGPRFRHGFVVQDATIRDVAPTILALLGYPVADDMDGRVLTELFRDAPTVQHVASYDAAIPQRKAIGRADGQVEEQLRALGYVQ
jgi:hypothetical protein